MLPSVGLQEIASRGVVLLSHSQGGNVALEMLSQSCAQPAKAPVMQVDICEGYQPPLHPVANVTSTGRCLTTHRAANGNSSSYSRQNNSSGSGHDNSRGSSAASSRGSMPPGILLGVVAFEVYRGGLQNPTGVSLVPGTFVLFLGGQYNNNTATAYSNTNASACACAGYARFAGLNHFGINNFQGDGQRQITPCARPGRSDPVNFTVSSARQGQALVQQAELVDGFIKAFVFQNATRARQLQQQAGNGTKISRPPAVPTGADQGFVLQLKAQCFNW